jgi:hypothetical protein
MNEIEFVIVNLMCIMLQCIHYWYHALCYNVKILLLNILHNISTHKFDSNKEWAKCSIPGRNKKLFSSQDSDWLWGVPSSCLVGTRNSFPKCYRQEADHSPSLCGEDKNATSTHFMVWYVIKDRENYASFTQ